MLGSRNIDLSYNWNQRKAALPSIDEVNDFLKTFKNKSPDESNKVSPDLQDIAFSEDQKIVLNCLKTQLQELEGKKVTKRPVKRVLVQGKAGSGKTTVIREIVRQVKSQLGLEAVAVAAATGMAAVNIEGKTLHSLFKLPYTYNSFEKLKPDQVEHLRSKFKNLKFLIIDEMSLVGLRLLYMINHRCQEIFFASRKEPFGGIYIYLFGDYNQLPPVGDDAVYSMTMFNDDMRRRGKKIFLSFQKRFLLENAHRQISNDSLLSKILDQVAKGELSTAYYIALIKRWQPQLRAEEINNFKNVLHLYPTNDKVIAHNENYLKSTDNPIARIEAINSSEAASKSSVDKSFGLQNILYLSIDCKIMLRTNTWVSGGLINGSMGTVREIIYEDNELPPKLPIFILAKVDNYKGPFIRNDLFPIIPVTRSWIDKGIHCTRTQLPVSAAYSTTIHKAQGQTLDKVKVDIGKLERSLGQTYVALSRVRTLSDLILINKYPKKRFDSIKNAKLYSERQLFLNSFSSSN